MEDGSGCWRRRSDSSCRVYSGARHSREAVVRGRRRAYCPAASSIIECMRYFFTVTVTLNLSVIFVTLIFVYAVNNCLIEKSFDGHV